MSKALEIVSERYAKGEITKEEFEEIKLSLGAVEEPTYISTTPSTEAPQPTISPIPANDTVHTPEWLPTAVLIGGAYLLACLVLAFGVDLKSRMYNAALSGCSNPNSALCQCVANASRNEITFLLAPFQMFGMFLSEDTGRQCVRVQN